MKTKSLASLPLLLLFAHVGQANDTLTFDLARASSSRAVCINTDDSIGRVLLIHSENGWSVTAGWKTTSPCEKTKLAVSESSELLFCTDATESSNPRDPRILFRGNDGDSKQNCRHIITDEPNSVYYGSLDILLGSSSLRYTDANHGTVAAEITAIEYLE